MIIYNKKLFLTVVLSTLFTACIVQEGKGAVTHIGSIAQFDEIIKKNLIVADFGTSWCPPCKQMAKVVDELAREMPKVQFLKIDTDSIPALAGRYNITSIPTFLFFKEGKQVHRFTGARSKNNLKQEIDTRLLR